jgi:hypothetical protein
MLEIIAIVAAVLAIAIVIVLILASTKPATFSVRRSAVVQAPAEAVFPLINDFHQWAKWSAWDGNKNVGSGRMEILDASSPSKITIKLDFFKPFEGHNRAEFTFVPEREAAATNVIWVMRGPSSFMSKVMQVFMDLDKMIGRDFEAGLANLKTLTEK